MSSEPPIDPYRGPTGRPIEAAEERRLIRLALNDAWSFEYHAPEDRDFWGIFWGALERSQENRFLTGTVSLTDFVAPGAGRGDER